MAMQENRPNIVVDENFLMLEKRLQRRYAERASLYSNAEAIAQERNGARAYEAAPEAYGDSRTIGGISAYKSGRAGGERYMTPDDFISYFERCHDTFGAVNFENIATAQKKAADLPVVAVNRKKVEQIARLNAKAAKKNRVGTAPAKAPAVSANVTRPTAQTQTPKIESNKLEGFFEKLATVKGRALASVAAVALCVTVALGGVMAFGPEDKASEGAPMANMRASQTVEQTGEEAHANLLSTLE